MPRRLLLYVLVIEALTFTVVLVDLVDGITVSAAQWRQFGLLLLIAHLHQVLSRDQEERRRAHHGSQGMHVDLTSIFAFPAAVLLPIPLAAVLIVTVRIARYRIARKPLFKYLMTSASILLSAFSAHGLATLAEGASSPTGGWDPALQLVLAAAGAVYMLQQMLVVGGAIVFSSTGPLPPLRSIFGDRDHLTHAAMSIGLGVVLAATITAPVAAVVMLAVSIVINNMVGQVERGRRDGGTGLCTKTRWLELATAALATGARDRRRAAVLVIDLDHFKQVNDEYGHLVGDMLLRRVAEVLTSCVRSGDVVGRFGGEEFVVLLGDGHDALGVAERIRQQVEQIVLLFERAAGGDPIVVDQRTASIGVARAPQHGTIALEALLQAADTAVYAAKHGGRNQVMPATCLR